MPTKKSNLMRNKRMKIRTTYPCPETYSIGYQRLNLGILYVLTTWWLVFGFSTACINLITLCQKQADCRRLGRSPTAKPVPVNLAIRLAKCNRTNEKSSTKVWGWLLVPNRRLLQYQNECCLMSGNAPHRQNSCPTTPPTMNRL